MYNLEPTVTPNGWTRRTGRDSRAAATDGSEYIERGECCSIRGSHLHVAHKMNDLADCVEYPAREILISIPRPLSDGEHKSRA